MAKRIQFKVEKGRVLVPVGEPCPFGCKYCYTRNGEVGPSRIEIEGILQPLQTFANQNEFETIQFGYDGDPFARPRRGIFMLQEIAAMGKHVNFSTKALLEETVLKALMDINNNMKAFNKTLSAQVSLSCWESAHFVEPHTPSPEERLITVKNLKSIDIPTFVCIRPILPNILDSEYEKLFEEGMLAGCDGIILGPLYADDAGRFVKFIDSEILKNVPSNKSVVSWSAHAPIWTRYEDKSRIERLELMAKNLGLHIFMSSADAVDFVNRSRVLV